MRLNQFLAYHLGCSRRQADQLIAAGQVKVNQELAKLGARVNLTDQVAVLRQGNWCDIQQIPTEKLLFYKPIFCLSNPESKVPQKKTIKQFLPKIFQQFRPVYKLAYMTEGLLILAKNRLVSKSLKQALIFQTSHFLLATKKPLPDSLVLEQDWSLDLLNKSSVIIQPVSKIDWSQFDYLKLSSKDYWYWASVLGLGDRLVVDLVFNFNLQRLICVRVGDYCLSFELYQRKWLAV